MYKKAFHLQLRYYDNNYFNNHFNDLFEICTVEFVRQYIGFEDEDKAEIQRVKSTIAAQQEREMINSAHV